MAMEMIVEGRSGRVKPTKRWLGTVETDTMTTGIDMCRRCDTCVKWRFKTPVADTKQSEERHEKGIRTNVGFFRIN